MSRGMAQIEHTSPPGRNEASERRGPADETDPGTLEKRARLERHFESLGSVLVCFSGGIDSALALASAHAVLGERAVGMTAVSPSLPDAEREAAVRLAERIGARHELVHSGELDDENYVKNGTDRCFYCKSELYRLSARLKETLGLNHIVNGTNTDDLGDHRPGLEAAKRAGISSPFVELGFGKDDVRAIARSMGLEIWNKPAAACLSSRIPFGTSVTRERLGQIGAFEAELRALGLDRVRVRWHSTGQTSGTREGAIARIEVDTSAISRVAEHHAAIAEAGKRHGFTYVTLDLEGYRQGSHNALLDGRRLRLA